MIIKKPFGRMAFSVCVSVNFHFLLIAIYSKDAKREKVDLLLGIVVIVGGNYEGNNKGY